ASRGLVDRHGRIAGDLETAMAATSLRLAPGQRHVHVACFEYLKAFADEFHSPHRFQQRSERVRSHAIDLDVDIFHVAAHQAIARATASATSSTGCFGPSAPVTSPPLSRVMTSVNSVGVETGQRTLT